MGLRLRHPTLPYLPDPLRRRAMIVAVTVLLAAGGAWVASRQVAFELESRYGLGWLYGLRGVLTPPASVLVVELNETEGERLSLPIPPAGAMATDCAELAVDAAAPGRVALGSPRLQPWPRCVHARLVDALTAAGARAVVFDVVFRPPRFRSDAERVALEALDRDFADALARSGRVVMALKVPNLACTRAVAGCQAVNRIEVSRTLLDAAAAAGPMLLATPRGDLYHAFWLFDPEDFGLGTLPLLALHAGRPELLRALVDRIASTVPRLREAMPDLPATGAPEPARLSGIVTELRVLLAGASRTELAQLGAIDDRIARLVRWYRQGGAPMVLNEYGPTGTLPALSYAEVIRLARTAPGQLAARVAGRTVFVGYLQHEEKEPFEQFPSHFRVDGLPDVSGVELAATAFANLEQDTLLRAAPAWPLFAATAAALVVVATLLLGPLLGGVLLVTGGAVFVGVGAWLFGHAFVWVPLVAPLAAGTFGYGVGVLLQYRRELRHRQRVATQLGRFVPADVAAQLATPQPNIRKTTYGLCLVTDAEGFTRFAESRPPEEVARFLDRYLALLFQPIIANHGYISDVIGDSVLAIFPCTGPRDAPVGAVLDASLAILAAVDAARDGEALPTRIGVAMGPMTQTMIGAFSHWEFRAVGDIVNTSNRVQALNKTLRTRILVTDAVARVAKGYRLRDRGIYTLSGKVRQQHVHELLGRD